MCGIFGAVAPLGRRLRHPDGIERMAAALRHRGPDGERIVGDECVRIGARRLAIMDLTTGEQPFQSPTGAVWMVCNGEIYNAPALRHEAAGWGYPFRSRGDIETIVPFYERHGAAAVEHLDGMFGLAIWDAARERLVLARDRAGEKPLFWTEVGGELRFASEIQALLVYPDQPRHVDRRALALYRVLGYVPAPHTMFAGIHKLPPGSVLEAAGGRIEVRAYWSPARAASAPPRLASAGQLRETLQRAVERQLMSDVPLGIFTSGGLDSSLLVAAAARGMPGGGERLHTYAVKFVEPGYDESRHAEAVTREITSIHHVVTADDAALERALDVVSRSLAEPLGDPAVLPTWLLAETARADVKVVLSGEGADELFGGYPTYLGHRLAEWWRRMPAPLAGVARWLIERWPASTGKVTLEFLLKQFVRAARQPLLERHLTWFGAGGQPEPGLVAELGDVLRDFPAGDPLNRMLWFDFVTYLPDNLLVKVDRATMLASIEARAPFLDREVLELVLPAPSAIKVRGLTAKAILKEAARGLVPETVIARRKRGLSVPVARWLNTGLKPLADRLLHTPLLAEHRSGRVNHARSLWPQLMLALWAERWGVNLDAS
ncbi:MAG: asparagine synthase (glutamine-hydrolyzing) [Gemmatimonadales bacterium]|nr:asparagine synthase (glutamine-hydrolyzing) [Gemmatimonadales bacterium]